MPVYLRKWYIRRLIKEKNREKKEMDKAKKSNRPKSNPRFK